MEICVDVVKKLSPAIQEGDLSGAKLFLRKLPNIQFYKGAVTSHIAHCDTEQCTDLLSILLFDERARFSIIKETIEAFVSGKLSSTLVPRFLSKIQLYFLKSSSVTHLNISDINDMYYTLSINECVRLLELIFQQLCATGHNQHTLISKLFELLASLLNQPFLNKNSKDIDPSDIDGCALKGESKSCGVVFKSFNKGFCLAKDSPHLLLPLLVLLEDIMHIFSDAELVTFQHELCNFLHSASLISERDDAGLCRQMLVLSNINPKGSFLWLKSFVLAYCHSSIQDLWSVEKVIERYLQSSDSNIISELKCIIMETENFFLPWQKVNILMLLWHSRSLFQHNIAPLFPSELEPSQTDIEQIILEILYKEKNISDVVIQYIMHGENKNSGKSGVGERGTNLAAVVLKILDKYDPFKNSYRKVNTALVIKRVIIQILITVPETCNGILRHLTNAICDRNKSEAVRGKYFEILQLLLNEDRNKGFKNIKQHSKIINESFPFILHSPIQIARRFIESYAPLVQADSMLLSCTIVSCQKHLVQTSLNGHFLSLITLSRLLRDCIDSDKVMDESHFSITNSILEELIGTLKRGLHRADIALKAVVYHQLQISRLIDEFIMPLRSYFEYLIQPYYFHHSSHFIFQAENTGKNYMENVFFPATMFQIRELSSSKEKSAYSCSAAIEPVGHLVSTVWILQTVEDLERYSNVLAENILGTTSLHVPCLTDSLISFVMACVAFLRNGGNFNQDDLISYQMQCSQTSKSGEWNISILQKLGMIATIAEGLLSCLLTASHRCCINDFRLYRLACSKLLSVMLTVAQASSLKSRSDSCSVHELFILLLYQYGLNMDKFDNAVLTSAMTSTGALMLLKMFIQCSDCCLEDELCRWFGIFHSLHYFYESQICYLIQEVPLTELVFTMLKAYEKLLYTDRKHPVIHSCTENNFGKTLYTDFRETFKYWFTNDTGLELPYFTKSSQKRILKELKEFSLTALLACLKDVIPLSLSTSSDKLNQIICDIFVTRDRTLSNLTEAKDISISETGRTSILCEECLCDKFSSDLVSILREGLPVNCVSKFLDLIEVLVSTDSNTKFSLSAASSLRQVITRYKIMEAPLFRRFVHLILQLEPLGKNFMPDLMVDAVSFLRNSRHRQPMKKRSETIRFGIGASSCSDNESNSSRSSTSSGSNHNRHMFCSTESEDRVNFLSEDTCFVCIEEVLLKLNAVIRDLKDLSPVFGSILALFPTSVVGSSKLVSFEIFALVNSLTPKSQHHLSTLLGKVIGRLCSLLSKCWQQAQSQQLSVNFIDTAADSSTRARSSIFHLNEILNHNWILLWTLSRYWSNFIPKHNHNLGRKLATIQYRMDRSIQFMLLLISNPRAIDSITLQRAMPKRTDVRDTSDPFYSVLETVTEKCKDIVRRDAEINGIDLATQCCEQTADKDDEWFEKKGKRIAKKRVRVRSRNKTIDEWLADESGSDAYADLEDFVVPEDFESGSDYL